ncbi:hypothetical protein KCU71_g5645, partial [Aureobasidium melanogenum]
MQTQALMGRGGYNRISAPVLGRGGYNRDIKTSGISRPSNPSSLVVRSARCVASDDGRVAGAGHFFRFWFGDEACIIDGVMDGVWVA